MLRIFAFLALPHFNFGQRPYFFSLLRTKQGWGARQGHAWLAVFLFIGVFASEGLSRWGEVKYVCSNVDISWSYPANRTLFAFNCVSQQVRCATREESFATRSHGEYILLCAHGLFDMYLRDVVMPKLQNYFELRNEMGRLCVIHFDGKRRTQFCCVVFHSVCMGIPTRCTTTSEDSLWTSRIQN